MGLGQVQVNADSDMLGEENHVVRRTAQELDRAAQRARCLGLALTFIGAAAMLLAAAFSGYTAVQARRQSQFNERLSKAIADYQFEHAKQAQESFGQLLNAIECANLEFAKAQGGLEALNPGAIAGCFQPPPAAPPPLPEIKKEGPK